MNMGMKRAVAVSFLALFLWSPGAYAETVRACTVADPPANCQNMWALQVNVMVPPSLEAETKDPGCALEANDDVLRIMRASRAERNPLLQEYSGPLAPAAEGLLGGALRRRGINVSAMLSPFHKDGVTCATVAVVTPWPTIYMGYRLLAADDDKTTNFYLCDAGEDCPIGSSSFLVEPVIQRNRTINVMYVSFANWSTDRSRTARLIIFYRMREVDKIPRTDWSETSENAAK